MPELRCASPGAQPRALAKPDVICGRGLAQTAIPTLLRVRAAGYVVCLAKRVVCVVGSCHRHRLPDRLPFIVRQNFLNYLDCLNRQSTGRVRNKRRGKLVQDHILIREMVALAAVPNCAREYLSGRALPFEAQPAEKMRRPLVGLV